MDPILRQVLQARAIEPHFLARLQTYIRQELQPALDERDALRAEVEALKARKKGAA